MPVSKERSWATERPYKAAHISIVVWTGRRAGGARWGKMRDRGNRRGSADRFRVWFRNRCLNSTLSFIHSAIMQQKGSSYAGRGSWLRDWELVGSAAKTPVEGVIRVPASDSPLSWLLGILGMLSLLCLTLFKQQMSLHYSKGWGQSGRKTRFSSSSLSCCCCSGPVSPGTRSQPWDPGLLWL